MTAAFLLMCGCVWVRERERGRDMWTGKVIQILTAKTLSSFVGSNIDIEFKLRKIWLKQHWLGQQKINRRLFCINGPPNLQSDSPKPEANATNLLLYTISPHLSQIVFFSRVLFRRQKSISLLPLRGLIGLRDLCGTHVQDLALLAPSAFSLSLSLFRWTIFKTSFTYFCHTQSTFLSRPLCFSSWVLHCTSFTYTYTYVTVEKVFSLCPIYPTSCQYHSVFHYLSLFPDMHKHTHTKEGR